MLEGDTINLGELRKIVSLCRKGGIAEIRTREIYIKFQGAPEKRILPAAIPVEENPIKGRLSQEKEDTALLLLEDPLEMERRIGSGELIDEVENA